VTPFVLARIAAATGGRAVTANVALVENNARFAAALAVALAAGS
jgi:pseudouridine-5'-phosphate glycosidase